MYDLSKLMAAHEGECERNKAEMHNFGAYIDPTIPLVVSTTNKGRLYSEVIQARWGKRSPCIHHVWQRYNS